MGSRSGTTSAAGPTGANERNRGQESQLLYSLSSGYMFDEAFEEVHAAAEPYTVVEEEFVSKGFIGWNVIWSYIKSGGPFLFFLTVFSHLIIIGSQAMGNIWLCMWTDKQCLPYDWRTQIRGKYLNDSASLVEGRELGIYGGIGTIQAVSIVVDCLVVAFGFLSASRHLHQGALYPLFRAPMSFFYKTPVGRILNYFSTDLDTVDGALALDVQLWLLSVTSLLSTIVTIIFANRMFLAIFLPLIAINFCIQRIYASSAIALKRLYAQQKSPVFSHFEETLCGTSSVRAYRKQEEFVAKCDKLTDDSHKPWHQYLVMWRWYTSYNEVVGAVAIFLTAAVAVVYQPDGEELGPGKIGLALFSVFQILPHIPLFSRIMIEIEANLVAVARIKKYSAISLEAPWDVPTHKPDDDWPSEGAIEFSHYNCSYGPGKDGQPKYALQDITCSIRSGEKVGIVGRTGAGKSSFALSLFRILEAEGHGYIEIDDIDIANIGLHELRSRLTVIPQDPVLFSGSLRMNLDPLEQYSDDEIWRALEHAHMKSVITVLDGRLNYKVESEEDFSVGQRQLLCMARALLRQSKVILLDEATAGIDYECDKLIQQTIQTEFSGSTVLTIAHRLETIIGYDRVMVIDNGKVLEFDRPNTLLDRPDSRFREMVTSVHGLLDRLLRYRDAGSVTAAISPSPATNTSSSNRSSSCSSVAQSGDLSDV